MKIKYLNEAIFSNCKIYWIYTRTTRDQRFADHELYDGKVTRGSHGELVIQATPVEPKTGCPFTLSIWPRQKSLEIEFTCNDCSGPIVGAEYFRDHQNKDVIITFSTDVEKVWVHLRAK